MTASTAPTDALSALTPLLRVRPALESLCRFGAQWASPHEALAGGWAPFHLVARGACILDLAGTAPVRLAAGDIAVLPHGGAHVMRGATTPAGTRATARLDVRPNGAILVKSNGEAGEATELICGRLQFEPASENLVLAILPPVIVARGGPEAGATGEAVRLGQMLTAIRDELDRARPGAAAIAADLASALLVMVLRGHFERTPAESGLLGLLARRRTARAVTAMLTAPDRSWTLDELAGTAGAARATLVRAFRQTAGRSPLAVLTELRLELARHRLLAGTDSLAAVAAQVGYQSESAFSRAFQRRYGLRPGEVRRAGADPRGANPVSAR